MSNLRTRLILAALAGVCVAAAGGPPRGGSFMRSPDPDELGCVVGKGIAFAFGDNQGTEFGTLRVQPAFYGDGTRDAKTPSYPMPPFRLGPYADGTPGYLLSIQTIPGARGAAVSVKQIAVEGLPDPIGAEVSGQMQVGSCAEGRLCTFFFAKPECSERHANWKCTLAVRLAQP